MCSAYNCGSARCAADGSYGGSSHASRWLAQLVINLSTVVKNLSQRGEGLRVRTRGVLWHRTARSDVEARARCWQTDPLVYAGLRCRQRYLNSTWQSRRVLRLHVASRAWCIVQPQVPVVGGDEGGKEVRRGEGVPAALADRSRTPPCESAKLVSRLSWSLRGKRPGAWEGRASGRAARRH